jgi:hypothetical protein
VIDGDAVDLDEFAPQILQIGIIEGKLAFERPIRHATTAL